MGPLPPKKNYKRVISRAPEFSKEKYNIIGNLFVKTDLLTRWILLKYKSCELSYG